MHSNPTIEYLADSNIPDSGIPDSRIQTAVFLTAVSQTAVFQTAMFPTVAFEADSVQRRQSASNDEVVAKPLEGQRQSLDEALRREVPYSLMPAFQLDGERQQRMKPERKCKKNIQSRVEHMYEDTGTSPGTD
jgi:hypothetical protein